MNILVYGAGVLGSLYAARLHEAGHEVSILARGQRLADIRQHGIVLEDGDTGQRATTQPNVVERLDPEDRYDLVVVLMRKNQISSILPTLAANHHTQRVLFMGNKCAGADVIVQALGPERVLLGFPGAGGYRQGYTIIYKIAHARQQPTTFGTLDGQATPQLQQIIAAFASAGFPVAISTNMDAWLKTHVAEVCPVANALYMANGDNYELARNRDGVELLVRAIREGYRVLNALDIPITPASHRIFTWIPESILVTLLQRLFNTKTAEIEMAGHANAAHDEFIELGNDFSALARATSVPTPAMAYLHAFADPTISPDQLAPERPLQTKRPWMTWPLIFFLLFLALGGLYGGIAMLADPTGNLLGVADIQPLLPVSNFVLPGLFVLIVMGVAPLLIAFGLIACPRWSQIEPLFRWSHHYWAWTSTLGLMAVLALWLIVEGLLIGLFPITYVTAIVGVLIVLFALTPGVRDFYIRE